MKIVEPNKDAKSPKENDDDSNKDSDESMDDEDESSEDEVLKLVLLVFYYSTFLLYDCNTCRCVKSF